MYRAHFINYKTWRFGWSGPLDHVLFWSMSHQICLKLPHRVWGTYKLSFPSGFEIPGTFWAIGFSAASLFFQNAMVKSKQPCFKIGDSF